MRFSNKELNPRWVSTPNIQVAHMVCRVLPASHRLYTRPQVHYASYTARGARACLASYILKTYVSYVAPYVVNYARWYSAVWDSATDLLEPMRFSVDASCR